MSDTWLEGVKRGLLPLNITDGTDRIKRKGQRQAAVLMPLVMRQGQWEVILTKRPDTMPKHPGQISFPGGKVEGEEQVREAALRETEEEIGIKPSAVTLLGRLPSFNAISDYRVTPFVGIVDAQAPIVPDDHEVADVFEVPLSFLMSHDNHVARDVQFDGKEHRMWDMPYTGEDGIYRNIWGMTAMMMYRLWERGFRDA